MISIIIPIYNMEKYLRECLDSVVAQTVSKEIICIDDGSTDGTINILNEYQKRYPDSFVLIQQNRQGSGVARNAGIKSAKGDFIAFMDADDYYPDEFALEKLYHAATTYGVRIAGGNIIAIDENGDRTWHGDHFDRDGMTSYYDFQEITGFKKYIYSKDIFLEDALYFPPYFRFQDPPFFMGVLTKNTNIYVIRDVVFCHRIGHKEVTFNKEVAFGVLCGIRDCFLIAYKNDLTIAYDKYLKSQLKGNFKLFYKYLYEMDDQYWSVFNEICEIERKWRGAPSLDISKEQLEKAVGEYRHLLSQIDEIKKDKVPLIIYGAGVGANELYKLYFDSYEQFVGFAVTDIKNEPLKNLEKKHVKGIEDYIEYKEVAVVVISLKRQDSQEEIYTKLKSIGFKNVIKIEVNLSLFQ